MTVRYVHFTVDLDHRTPDGKPRVYVDPRKTVLCPSDLVVLSLSILENGAETVVLEVPLRTEPLKSLVKK